MASICSRLFFLVAIFSLVGCSSKPENSDGEKLVKVGNHYLTISDLSEQIPSGLSPEDSVRYARAYINEWISNELINEVAPTAIGDMSRIDKMVEDYRRQLIAGEYKRLRQGELLSRSLDEDSLMAYYLQHNKDFTLSQPILKGIYIKADSADNNINQILKLISSNKSEDLDRLEKTYSDKLIHFDYFRDQWMPWNKIDALIPFPASYNPNELASLKNPKVITTNGFTYILSVSDFLPAGSIAPFETVKQEVSRAIIRENTVDLYAEIINELLEEGLKNGEVEIFCDLNR